MFAGFGKIKHALIPAHPTWPCLCSGPEPAPRSNQSARSMTERLVLDRPGVAALQRDGSKLEAPSCGWHRQADFVEDLREGRSGGNGSEGLTRASSPCAEATTRHGGAWSAIQNAWRCIPIRKERSCGWTLWTLLDLLDANGGRRRLVAGWIATSGQQCRATAPI